MKEKQEIILHYFREGKSIRRISRETGLSRQTVSKYVKSYQESNEKLTIQPSDISSEALYQDIVERPKYKTPNRSKRKLTKEIGVRIDELLEVNLIRKRNKQRKQLLKKKDIFDLLRQEGFDIGYTSVCEYINSRTDQFNETFIKQIYAPGSECEFDWGEIKLNVGGKLRSYQLALFTSAYSNFYFGRVYSNQTTPCFQESHADFFEKTGCVYETMVYDNMRVAVKRMVGNSEKEPTEGLLQLSMFYQFHIRFCNVGKGNEKGHVERGIEFVRRKAFSLNDSFSDISEVNKALESTCDRLNQEKRQGRTRSSQELFLEEKEILPASKVKFSSSEKTSCRVNKYSIVSYKSCFYSVPEEYNGKIVDLRVFSNKILIYDDLKLICIHIRKHGRSEWSLDINHYLRTLIRKPGALKGSLALSQSSEKLKSIHENHFHESPKSFIELLLYMKESKKDIGEIEVIIEKLKILTPKEVALDQIKMLGNQSVEIHRINSFGQIAEQSIKQISDIMNTFSEEKNKDKDLEVN